MDITKIIQNHFVGIPSFWKALTLWMGRIFGIFLIIIPLLGLLGGETISFRWIIEEAAIKIFSVLLPVFVFLAILLPIPLVIIRLISSLRFCRKNEISMMELCDQNPEQISKIWTSK